MSSEGRLTLKGRFKYGLGYVVNLPENFTLAGQTYVPTVTSFFMPDHPPKLEYVEKKSLIELDSRELLHVRAENVKSLLLEGVRIPPLLLPQALVVEDIPADWDRLLTDLQAGAEELQSLAKGHKALAPFLREPFAEKQLFPAPTQKNKALAVSLPLSFRRDKEAGALELIRVSPDEEGGPAATDPRVFRITDLGLTYKSGANQLLLWATSLKNAAPLAGVQVVGLTKDMEAFPLGQTDQDGIFIFQPKELEGLNLKTLGKFQPVKRRVEQGQLVCLLAGTAKDISYILLKPADSLKPQGIWQVRTGEQVRCLKGEVFTERGVYRPGETVHFKGLVREYRTGHILSPQGEVCTFEITSPKGEKVYSGEGALSDFGGTAAEVATAGYWPLGTYTLKMAYGPIEEAKPSPSPKAQPRSEDEDDNSNGNDHGNNGDSTAEAPKNEASCTFQIQEFKPPRHFVEIDFKRLTRSETGYVNLKREQEFVRIGLTGAYYAGGPVKHGQVRWKVHKAKTSYQVPGYDNFVFGYSREEPGELIESGQALLDEKGRTELEFPLDRQVLAGESGYLVIATVVDFDGRAASDSKSYQVEPDYLVGFSSHPEEVRPEEEQVVKVVAVTKDGKKVTQGQIRAEVLERSYSYVPKRNEQGDLYWSDQESWRKIYATDLPLEKGEASFKFGFGWYGRYRVAFTYTDERGRSFASATAYQVESVGGRYAEAEGKEQAYQILPLSADRPAYEPGQTAKISLRPKRPVSCYLVTLEQNGLLQHRVVQAQKELKDLEIPIQGEYAPNVYVSVLAITPRGDFPVFSGRYDTEAPGFFWGNLNLPVRLEVEQLQVQISPAIKELRAEPGANFTLDFVVHNKKGQGIEAEMAVAVVDEAVLALTGFKTPTLDRLTRFDGPLGVFTGDLRAFLLNQTPFYLARNDILTGGGGLNAAMLAKLRKRFEPVAFFNPAVRTGPDGRAQVTFTLPDNMTSYRIYAVTADRGSGFASPERQLVATKDFYVEPGMPGFFNQGDKFRFQVAAFNNTSATGPVKFKATAEGGLALKAEEPKQPLQAKDSMKLNVSGEATQAGPATARFGAEFQGRADAAELKLEINSGHVRDTSVFSGSVSGPSQIKVTLPPYLTGDWAQKLNPGEVQAVLTLSGSPFLRLSDALHYLLTYPYGCVEQTSSGVLALAALRGVVQDGQVPGLKVEEVDKYLSRGVQRVLSLQVENGGFSYWPGQSEASGWGSIYAGAALSIAKKNGVDVPEGPLGKALDYFHEQIKNPKTPDHAKAFAAYILALNGALDRAEFQGLGQSYARVDREGRLLLLLAAKEANLRPPADLRKDLKPLLGPDIAKETRWGWDEFNALARGPAMALLAAKAIMPEDPLTKQTALLLLGGLDQQGIWTSTSSTGWALVALGAYFQGQKLGTEPGEVTVSQPGVVAKQQVKLDPKGFRTVGLEAQALLKNPVVVVEAKSGPTWLYKLELTGPRLDLAGAGADQGFRVSKTIQNTDGSAEIKVGDLVKIVVVIEAAKPQRYVVLDDPLPAGLVAVNTALKTEQYLAPGAEESGEDDNGGFLGYAMADGTMLFYPNFFEIREDRVLAFRDQLYSGKYRFEYYARAVCEGHFLAPPTKAAAMYSPGVNGFTAQSDLTVKAR
ncbi:MAG: alpha-2-macroglobulin [Desulfobaccales bacterium]